MAKRSHGLSRTTEYASWKCARNRCHNKNDPNYGSYGARGIFMDARWRNDPVQFVLDMGLKPSPEHTLERLDVNGPYSKQNCVWATMKEQGNNRRDNVCLTLGEETMTLTQWADRLGVSPITLNARHRKGMSDEDVLLTPINSRHSRDGFLLTFNGRTMNMKEWADETGIAHTTLCYRLSRAGTLNGR